MAGQLAHRADDTFVFLTTASRGLGHTSEIVNCRSAASHPNVAQQDRPA